MADIIKINIWHQHLQLRLVSVLINTKLINALIITIFAIIFNMEPLSLMVDFMFFHILTSKLSFHFSTKLVGTRNYSASPLRNGCPADTVLIRNLPVTQMVVEFGNQISLLNAGTVVVEIVKKIAIFQVSKWMTPLTEFPRRLLNPKKMLVCQSW